MPDGDVMVHKYACILVGSYIYHIIYKAITEYYIITKAEWGRRVESTIWAKSIKSSSDINYICQNWSADSESFY